MVTDDVGKLQTPGAKRRVIHQIDAVFRVQDRKYLYRSKEQLKKNDQL
jgi:hypothetical protein